MRFIIEYCDMCNIVECMFFKRVTCKSLCKENNHHQDILLWGLLVYKVVLDRLRLMLEICMLMLVSYNYTKQVIISSLIPRRLLQRLRRR